MAGLILERKEGIGLKVWLIVFAVILSIGIAGFIAYWYVTGSKPSFLPFPAFLQADTSVDEKKVSGEDIEAHKVDDLKPRYISIPTLNIEKSRIQPGGIKNGVLITPKNIHDAAWYEQSATPGQGYGVVVLNGHSMGVSTDGLFKDLQKIAVGDYIEIERGDGKKFRYDVVDNKTQPLQLANKSGIKELFMPYDKTKEGLGIVSFAGNWIPKDRTFDQRVLIRAVIQD